MNKASYILYKYIDQFLMYKKSSPYILYKITKFKYIYIYIILYMSNINLI